MLYSETIHVSALVSLGPTVIAVFIHCSLVSAYLTDLKLKGSGKINIMDPHTSRKTRIQ